MFTRRLSFKIS